MAFRTPLTRLDGVMNSLLSNPLIWVALVVFLVARQFMPRAVNARWMIGIPLIAGFLGLQALISSPPDGIAATLLLGVNVAVGAVGGLLRGATVRMWRADDGTWMTRGTLLTLALWAVLIVVKVGLALLGRGATAMNMNDIALFVAVTFGAQNLVVLARMQGREALAAAVRVR
jgi:hypothetical protein